MINDWYYTSILLISKSWSREDWIEVLPKPMQIYIEQRDNAKKVEYAMQNIEGLIVDIEKELLQEIAGDPLPGNLQLSFYVHQLLSPGLKQFTLSGDYEHSEKEYLESSAIAPARPYNFRGQQLQKYKWIRNIARHRYSINVKALQSVQIRGNFSISTISIHVCRNSEKINSQNPSKQ